MEQDKSTSSPSGRSSQGQQSEQGGRQQLSRTQQGAGLAQADRLQSYFPSPGEFFTNPFAVMRRMQDDMDRMLAQAFGGGFGGGLMTPGAGAGATLGSGMAAWSPSIEVREQGNEMVVSAELPGLKPEEVQVEVNEDGLVIQGERRQEETSGQGGVHRTERRYGRFYRAIPLPEGADAERAKAEFRNGVLEVSIPVPQQQSKRRQIPIAGASTGGKQG
jgi:HSP20 family protein